MPRSARTKKDAEDAEFFGRIDQFFQGRGPVHHQTMRRLVQRLRKAKIVYAIVGGMAVNAHGHERMTKDVDVLLTAAGFEEFKRLFVPGEYEAVSGRGRRFSDPVNGQLFDIRVTGLFPGSGKPGPIAYPDPADVSEIIKNISVVNLVTLITLKLCARRHQDFADVVNLISVHHLDESIGEGLHPTLRRDYVECLEEKRREDSYLSRET